MTVEEYKELYRKMLNDKAFAEASKKATNGRELYDIYKQFGYTDAEYDEFVTAFKEQVQSTANICAQKAKEDGQLSDEELDSVVGGAGVLDTIRDIFSLVPIFGPVVAGLWKVGEDIYNKKGLNAFNADFTEMAIGVLADGVGCMVGASAIKGVWKGLCIAAEEGVKLTANTYLDEYFRS